MQLDRIVPEALEPDRRQACAGLLTAAILSGMQPLDSPGFEFRYLLASSLYGYLWVGEILPEVRRTGAAAIDLWPKVHGNQREQLAVLGEAAFTEMLESHKIQLGCLTHFGLGPFRLKPEMELANRMGCRTIVTGGQGPAGLRGSELKSAVGAFVEDMKPHLDEAANHQVTIAIENHGSNLFETADALKWLVEFRPSRYLAIALAPYHLPQDSRMLSQLIRNLGNAIEVFYAWQFGKGCHQKLPQEQERLQLPGRGDLDFAPIVAALQEIQFSGWTEIFMHPVPRGISILPSVADCTAEINLARKHLDSLIR